MRVEAAASAPESPTFRRCIVTRQALEKPAMIRFVIDPEDRVTPDLKERLPGRGLWVTADRAVLAQAVAKNAFAKAARQSVRVGPDLVDRVAELAKREVAELLGLAKKSGQLTAGFEKVEARLRAGRIGLLIAASDGAEDGRGKLARIAGSGVEICAPLNAAELAQAIGRDHAVHAAIRSGGIATRIAVASRRLAGLTEGRGPEGKIAGVEAKTGAEAKTTTKTN
ncbi:MAG: RNA-binding protein [Dongiaceae bacterium]